MVVVVVAIPTRSLLFREHIILLYYANIQVFIQFLSTFYLKFNATHIAVKYDGIDNSGVSQSKSCQKVKELSKSLENFKSLKNLQKP